MGLYSKKIMPTRDGIYALTINDLRMFDIHVVSDFNDLGSLNKDKLEQRSNLYSMSIKEQIDEYSNISIDDNINNDIDNNLNYEIRTSNIENNEISKIILIRYLGNGVFEEISTNIPILMNVIDIEGYFHDESREESKIVSEEFDKRTYSNNIKEFMNKSNELLKTPLSFEYDERTSIFVADEEIISRYINSNLTNLKKYMNELNDIAKKHLNEQINIIPMQDEYFAHVINELKKKL